MTSRSILPFAVVCALAAPAAQGLETRDCIILPSAEISLGAPTPGLLQEIAVDRNTKVARGDVLAALQSEQERAALALAQLRAEDQSGINTAEIWVAFEKSLLDRARSLSDRNVVSDQQLAEREANYAIRLSELEEAKVAQDLARLELVQAEARLAVRQITSPVDGVVTERLLEPGEFAREDTPVLRLAVLDPLRVEIFLPQEAYLDIAAGDVAMITPEGALGAAREAVVTTIDPLIDAASGTFGVRLEMPNADRAVIAGVHCVAALASSD